MTGSELREPGEALEHGEIYDANGAVTTDPTTVRSARISVTVAPRQAQGGSGS